ncbi:AIR synthase-related protein [Lachnospiraceae bacterium 42-17]
MESKQVIYKMRTAFGQSENIGIYALQSVINELAAEGGADFYVNVKLLRPYGSQKAHMYAVEKKIKGLCRDKGVHLDAFYEDMQAGISHHMVIVAGISIPPKEQEWYRETMRAGQDIVLTKWAGMEGMLRIAEEKKEELEKRFAPVFLRQIEDFGKEVCALREIDIAKNVGVTAIREAGEGGIFAALWRLAKEARTGIAVDLKKISVLQETIEVCEYYHLNPYQLASAGSLLIVTDNGSFLTESLLADGLEASLIGRLTDNNDKLIKNGEEQRYVDRPAPDELNRIFMEDRTDERH